ncbi:MAG: molybdopterin-dependent oxidoreductase [Acidobacteria bacterium]|nr:molybdopterin-dependent oxidoreductase [Acidobacteriota bacterium]MCW5971436.1 molybdopterin-dependent oxidoreductase [Blastocatellales bacterium]
MNCKHNALPVICLSICLSILLAVALQAQTPPAAAPAVSVSGEVEKPVKLTAADLGKLPRRSIRAKGHDGKESEFEGVPLVEVLKTAGVKFGEKLRGKHLALYLLVEAADAYRAVYALPELDPAFTDKLVLLADRRDGKPLDEKEGPLRLVVPDEKRHGRWVRQVTGLVIKRAP